MSIRRAIELVAALAFLVWVGVLVASFFIGGGVP